MNRFNRQVGDWTKLRSGHVVVDRDDPLQEGRIEAIRHGFFAVVKWANTGCTSKLPIERLERVQFPQQKTPSISPEG
ncbi:MAG: hypothetical protein WCF15_17520 [Pseudolabrys sp.]|jgi:hypothetical protein